MPGADDYVAKPFQTEELIARLRALIRRASGNASAELIAGDIRLDTRSGKVTKDGEPVKLTAQEYKLLSYLLHHKGKVVSRTELIEHIYDQDFGPRFEHDRSVRDAHPQEARRRRHHHHPRARLQPRGARRGRLMRPFGLTLSKLMPFRRRPDPVAVPVDALDPPPRSYVRVTGSVSRRMAFVAAAWIMLLLLGGGFTLDRVVTAALTKSFDDQLVDLMKKMLLYANYRPRRRSAARKRLRRPALPRALFGLLLAGERQGLSALHLAIPVAGPAAQGRPAPRRQAGRTSTTATSSRASGCVWSSRTRCCPIAGALALPRSPNRAPSSTRASPRSAAP